MNAEVIVKVLRIARYALIAAVALVVISFFTSAPFDPFCTYDLTYRLTATIDVDGEQYTSQVVRQRSFSRNWIEGMNSGGCRPSRGTVLSYRIKDNRVVLIGSNICRGAIQSFLTPKPAYQYPPPPDDYRAAMRERRTIDLAQFCFGLDTSRDRRLDSHYGISRAQAQAYLVDDAERPARWEGFNFGNALKNSRSIIRLVSASVQAIDASPHDDLARVAPGLLKARFTSHGSWGPEELVAISRRASIWTSFSRRSSDTLVREDAPPAIPKI